MEQLQYQEGRTEIGQLGKVALIDRLTDGTACQGDDCAVIGKGKKRTLVTVQTLVEGVDFDMMYTPLKHLGYKAVAVAISNVAAMNGSPRQADGGFGKMSSSFLSRRIWTETARFEASTTMVFGVVPHQHSPVAG